MSEINTTKSDADLIAEAAAHVRGRMRSAPTLALILGSGLGQVADELDDKIVLSTSEIPHFPASTVEGHAGELVFGQMDGKDVAVLRGRVHAYEGLDARQVTFPIRLLHAIGVEELIVTNAAGGINPSFEPGTLMFIEDHINHAFLNPLAGPNDGDGPRFPDMSAPYDPDWLSRSEEAALQLGIATRRGVYLWTLGPSYETKAEVRAFARLGADAVGMSTVPEVIQAIYLGMRVLGISTITNYAAGLSDEPLAHDDVMLVGARVRTQLATLVKAIASQS